MTVTLTARSRLSADAPTVSAYLARPAAAERLVPPWDPDPRAHPAVHSAVSADGAGCMLVETVTTPVGRRDRVARLLAYRQRTIALDLARRARLPPGPLRIAISGASGLIGTALAASIAAAGDTVVRLVRRAPRAGADEIQWDPDGGVIAPAAFAGIDAVVHLAGESIAGGRWTDDRKRRIRESRERGTGLVARAIAAATPPPRVFLSASGVGIYGARGDELVDETTPPGDDFLAEVARAWEAAAGPAAARGVRVVHPRFGNVLSPRGGMLQRLLTPFRAGLGGRIGKGDQGLPWVSLEDVVGALHHALTDERLSGPMNVVAPTPATSGGFTSALGQALGRPTVLPLPAFAVSLAFGEMGRALLLAGQNVVPRRLLETGYDFVHPTLAPTLAELLGRAAPPFVESDGAVQLAPAA